MKSVAGVLTVVLLLQLAYSQSSIPVSPTLFKIPANTAIRVRTRDGVSSETARVGDDVQMEVLGDVVVGGFVVVRQGASAVGQISQVKEARTMGRRGNVALTLNYVEAVTGEHLLVGGSRAEKGKGKTAKITTEIVATTLVTGGLVGALWLFEKGHDTDIPPGTAFTVYTLGDTTLDLSNLAQPLTAAVTSTHLVASPGGVLPRPTSSSSLTIPSLGIVVATRANMGAEIIGVVQGRVADRAGLKVGYVIALVDGKEVKSAPDIVSALANRDEGSRVAIAYFFRSGLGWMPSAETIITPGDSHN